MRTKKCKYCGREFNDLDFPAQFNRMITCGRIECMRMRRWENQGIVRAGTVEKVKKKVDTEEIAVA